MLIDAENRAARRGLRRAATLFCATITAVAAVNGVGGYLVLGSASDSPLSHADAIVVLGGEHDGREDYGLALAGRGLASTVVLSDPYRPTDRVMARVCRHRDDAIEVLCARPEPSTTRGEAKMTRRLALQRHWKHIIVVTWRYHLPRARLIFGQCLSAAGVSIAATSVPRAYELPVGYWQYLYFYQFGGIAKAIVIGAEGC